MLITQGVIPSAQKCLIYGPEGIGKSTFASQFPSPLFIDTEGSTKHLNVRRLAPPTSWAILLDEVRHVAKEGGVCETLVIDTADWAERLCIAHVCAKAQKGGIEDFGYGKGYTYLAEEFGRLLNLLSEVVESGIHVLLCAHAQIRKFEQPDEMAAYDRWELKLQKKTAPLVKEWCDMVLFANYKTFAVKDDDGKAKAAGGKRVIRTTHHPAWDAKNRHGLADELPFEFASIAHVFSALSRAVAVPETAAAAQPEKECDTCGLTGKHDEECTAAVTAPTPGADIPARLKPLYDLMRRDGVTEEQLRRAVLHRGYYPEKTPIEAYDQQFVDGRLIAHWDQVRKIITELDSVPFK